MYYDFQVEIPEAKGKIITKKKGSVTYVLYQYGQEYKSEKRYAIPKRAIIGKVSSENSSMMFPNEQYQGYFPDAVLPGERNDADRSCCLRIGSWIVIRHVLDEYHLSEMLYKPLGKIQGCFWILCRSQSSIRITPVSTIRILRSAIRFSLIR